ncbi:MAG: peptidase T [Lachnospiraceae bacterium]|nr:peptidase T [Lachnospiraceae bacterium]
MSTLLERFYQYVQIDTQSSEDSVSCPSTQKQFDLARLLAAQLKELGASSVRLDEKNCYVYAELPATEGVPASVPSIGFIAHMDTSPAVSGKGVSPQLVKHYDGGDILLSKEEHIVLSPKDFPELLHYIGQDLITTDGTTLLGADDKAGVAEIMTMAEYLLTHPELRHGKICIAFTPDEEVGCGVDAFDIEHFGADYAYTVDGGPIGELEYENFNAAGAILTVNGRSVHPGDAKGKMLNSILLLQEFQSMLPQKEMPQYTEKYEGFLHLDSIRGNVEQTIAEYIIRDHDRSKFEAKKELFETICSRLNEKYGAGTFIAEIKDSYYNMKEKITPHMFLIDHAKKAMKDCGVTPIIQPIRGGTDGARLSFMGLPCPNLCTGGHNYHGRYEYCCVQSMETIVEILVKLAVSFAE